MTFKLAAATLMIAATPALAQHDFMGGRSAEEIVSQHAGDMPAFEAPSLNIGDDAPDLAVTEFVKGAPFDSFEEGKVYLVDFWATWCGPCIRAMPHLSDLQDKHSGDGLTILAVDIWENKRTPEGPEPIVGEERTELVENFVKKHDENMRYTVAIDGEQELEETWMDAAGQRGIPTAMIVDRNGKMAWIGYGTDPSMDEHLKKILADEHDLDAMRAERLEAMEAEHARESTGRLIRSAQMMLRDGKDEEGLALMAALSKTEFAEDAMMLNAMAWPLVDPQNRVVSTHRAKLAVEMATQACELTDWEDSNVLDTLAWGYHHLHQHDKAVKIEEKAIKHATDDRQREAFEKVLEIFQRAAESHDHGHGHDHDHGGHD